MTREITFLNDQGEAFPEWEQKRLGDITENLDNERIPMSSGLRITIRGDIPYYGATGIVDYINDFIFDEELILLGEDGVDFENFADKPIAQFVTGKSWVNNHAHVFRAKIRIVTSKFLYYSLAHKDVTKYVVGGGRAKLNKGEALKIELSLPSLPEQEKIAEFFSALDERVELVDNKVRLLKEQKKGYLQRVFAQEMVFTDDNGDTFPEWEQKKLGEVAKIIMGQSPDGNSYSEDSSNTVLIQGNADMKDGHVIPRIYTSAVTKTCAKGDIIMSVRAPVGALAKTDIDACIGRGVCAIRGNDFVYHFLQYHQESGGWKKIAQGSTFEAVSSIDVNRLLIPLPSLPEQEKIADFFSALDEQIELNENKLALLKEQKKGYLQGIFG